MSGTLGEKNYLLLLSVIVGLVSGIAAVILRFFSEEVRQWSLAVLPDSPVRDYLIPLLPAFGIFICILFVRYWIRKPYEKGLAGVIVATSHGTSDIPVQKTFSHIITSGISVGCGVSAGLEAPIALTGSAIGSNIAKLFHLGRESRTLLLACGAAGGISAVFNSPVAGALFACEILLSEFSVAALIPLLLASASAAVLADLIYPGHAINIPISDWTMYDLPTFIVLGLLAGLLAAFVIKTSCTVSRIFEPLKNVWLKGAAGAVLLYVTFLLFPALRGEGYDYITGLLDGTEAGITDHSLMSGCFANAWFFLLLIGLLVMMKAVISPVGLEAGADGGIFAPSMFMGAFLGFFTARLSMLTGFWGSGSIDTRNFMAVGMGGVLAGVMHAPMTGIFLIAEITGGYRLFVPLMIVASISFFVCRKLSQYNVYKSVIAMRGGMPDVTRSDAAMETIHVGELAETDIIPVRETDSLREFLSTFMHSKRNVFPVLDSEDHLIGIVSLDSVRPFLLNSELYDVALVYDVMEKTGPVLNYWDNLGDAVNLFNSCHVWNLPVVHNNGKYAGFVSKAGVFDKYRNELQQKRDLF